MATLGCCFLLLCVLVSHAAKAQTLQPTDNPSDLLDNKTKQGNLKELPLGMNFEDLPPSMRELASQMATNKENAKALPFGMKFEDLPPNMREFASQMATNRDTRPSRPPQNEFVVVRSFSHDSEAFTQGLVYDPDNTRLFESTGKWGFSTLRELDPLTGTVMWKISLPPHVFGEGIALLHGRMYQLSYQQRFCYVYTPSQQGNHSSWKFEKRLPYPEDGPIEGWGLTSDGHVLYMSDGTANIRVLDDDFRLLSTLAVQDDGGFSVDKLNDLAFVSSSNQLLANVLGSRCVARIDAHSGRIVGWVSAHHLYPSNPNEWVNPLNGITPLPEAGHFLMTGKNWPRMYEVEVANSTDTEVMCPDKSGLLSALTSSSPYAGQYMDMFYKELKPMLANA